MARYFKKYFSSDEDYVIGRLGSEANESGEIDYEGYTATPNYSFVRMEMGEDFLGSEEIEQLLQGTPTGSDVENVSEETYKAVESLFAEAEAKLSPYGVKAKSGVLSEDVVECYINAEAPEFSEAVQIVKDYSFKAYKLISK